MNDKIKKETIVFLSKDGYRIELDKEKSIISETLIQLFEDVEDNNEDISLQYCANIINIMVEYINCYFSMKEKSQSEGIEFLPEKKLTDNSEYISDLWENDFIPEDMTSVIYLAELAYFLKIKPLCNLLFSKIGKDMENKTPEEIQEFFQIDSFEPDIHEFIRENNGWDSEDNK